MPGGRRAAHSRDEFVVAALSIADEAGLSKLSIRTLASAKGVTAATVYRYFTDKDDLLSAMWQAILGSLISDLPDGSPSERLIEVAKTFRARVEEHPCVIELSVIPASEGTFAGVATYIIEQIRGLGLKGAQLVHSYRQYESFVIGTCLFDFAGAPDHLSTRLQRMKFLDDPDFNATLRSARDIGADNQMAFENSLRLLVNEFSVAASQQ